MSLKRFILKQKLKWTRERERERERERKALANNNDEMIINVEFFCRREREIKERVKAK